MHLEGALTHLDYKRSWGWRTVSIKPIRKLVWDWSPVAPRNPWGQPVWNPGQTRRRGSRVVDARGPKNWLTNPMVGALTLNWPPLAPCPNFSSMLFESKTSHSRGPRREHEGNKEFHWFKVGCLGPKPPHMGCWLSQAIFDGLPTLTCSFRGLGAPGVTCQNFLKNNLLWDQIF